MDHMELVEQLRAKTGVSYAEAKAALEHENWDVLDALIYLEAQGKATAGSAASYSTRAETSQEEPQSAPKEDGFVKCMKAFGAWIKRVFHKGHVNRFVATREGKEVVSVPVTVLVVLMIFAFWLVLPLMGFGLFFSYRYGFRGPDLGKESVNDAMGKATDAVDGFKSELREE